MGQELIPVVATPCRQNRACIRLCAMHLLQRIALLDYYIDNHATTHEDNRQDQYWLILTADFGGAQNQMLSYNRKIWHTIYTPHDHDHDDGDDP